MSEKFNKISIADVPFNPVTYDQVLGHIRQWMGEDKKRYITTPNPEIVLEAGKNKEFKKVLNNASLSVPDGVGILWAAHYLSLTLPRAGFARALQLIVSLVKVFFSPKSVRNILPQRVTGSDLFYRIIEESQKHQWRIFLEEAGFPDNAADSKAG